MWTSDKVNGPGLTLFPEEAAAWLETRKPYLAPSTSRDYGIYIKTLSAFFGEMSLAEISADQIRAYQRARLVNVQWAIINKETSVLQQMLKRIGRWPAIAHDFQPLPRPRDGQEIGRCISDDEESRFFRCALTNSDWRVAAMASLISVNTTAGPGEILHLRLRDVDLTDKLTLRIGPESAKNYGRIRVIPLNEGALWAMKVLLARARTECGCAAPEHYLIPFNEAPHTYNPYRPQASYYKAFNAILERAKLDFRPYDFRHTAITRMLENPDVPLEVARSISGHISERMIRRYFHGRLAAQRSAVVAALVRKPPRGVIEMLRNPGTLRLRFGSTLVTLPTTARKQSPIRTAMPFRFKGRSQIVVPDLRPTGNRLELLKEPLRLQLQTPATSRIRLTTT